MKPRILVTPRSVTRSGHPSLEKLRQVGCEVLFCQPGVQPGEEELRTLLPGCVGYLAGVEPITSRVLEAADRLRVISRNGAGMDNVDLDAAQARGIKVLRADGANARGVAELAFGQMFALARGVTACDRHLKAGVWERGGAGIELEGRTLGLAGCGRIGKLLARLALGIGMNVKAFDLYPDATFQPGAGFRFAALDEVLETADFLSLHCPPGPDGHPLLDATALGRMKRGVFVINTARYEVMDAEAVFTALQTGHIAGLALDVFDAEPPGDRRLVEHPRVIATAHLGGFTQESIRRAMDLAVENILSVLPG